MYGTPGGQIPSVGKVELAWVQTPLPPINLSTKTPLLKSEVEAKPESEDSPMEGDAMAHDSSPAHALGHGHDPAQENIDYDVADDNDWV